MCFRSKLARSELRDNVEAIENRSRSMFALLALLCILSIIVSIPALRCRWEKSG